MAYAHSVIVAGILDRMIREKEISAAFFIRIAESLSDVDQRRWFRRLGQDEKDQRKILLKHRRSICGTPPAAEEEVGVSAIHHLIHRAQIGPDSDLVDALRLAVRSAEHSRDYYGKSSDLMTDRSCRIFLKILGEESEGHRRALLTELRRVERELVGTVEDLAA